MQYDLFCMETVLPDLTELLVSIARSKPTDPLLFAIETITAKAKSREEKEEAESKIEFDDLLLKSSQEIKS